MATDEATPQPIIIEGFGKVTPPSDPLKAVFTPEVRDDWRHSPTDELRYRLQVLCACGSYPSDPMRNLELHHLRAQKAAWETYIFTAYACGMFEGERGQEILNRLASRDSTCFRSAMAECEVCWFFAARMRLPFTPISPGRKGKNLDMQIVVSRQEVGVEVKAPFREQPSERFWWGDDSDKIIETMNAANKQFADDRPNILALVPRLRHRCFSDRHDLMKAAFGQSKITWPINTKTGKGGPTTVKFSPDGRFLNTKRPGGKPLKSDGLPGYRRISAIICIEDIIVERHPFPDPFVLADEKSRWALWPLWKRAYNLHLSLENCAWIEHNVLILHNPNAYYMIPRDLFGDYPQLVPVGEQMQWTDGEKIIV